MQMKRQVRKETPSEAKARPKKGVPERAKEPESGAVDSASSFSTHDHVVRLGAAGSEQERAEIMIGLQQAYGNAYVQRVVQAKLSLSQPGDVYEQEADRVASEITRGAGEQAQRMTPEEEEPPIQGKAIDSGGLSLSEDMETRIEDARGGGAALPETTRADVGPRLGVDLSTVRVHTDAAADSLARDLSAEAFTTGRDVFFRSGTYQPDTVPGKTLLTHELTHVVQQQAAPAVQRDTAPGTDDERFPDIGDIDDFEDAGPAQQQTATETATQAGVESVNAETQQTGTETATESGVNAVDAAAQQTTAEQATQAGVASATGTQAPAPAAQSVQQAALRGIWDSVFVANVTRATEAAAASQWAASKSALDAAAPVLSSIMEAYRATQPDAYIAMQDLRLELATLWESTATLSGNLPRAEGVNEDFGRLGPMVARVGGML